jgi:hypothetical protein
MPLIEAGLAASGLGLIMCASAAALVWSIVCSYTRRPRDEAAHVVVADRPKLRVIQGGKVDEGRVTRSAAGY